MNTRYKYTMYVISWGLCLVFSHLSPSLSHSHSLSPRSLSLSHSPSPFPLSLTLSVSFSLSLFLSFSLSLSLSLSLFLFFSFSLSLFLSHSELLVCLCCLFVIFNLSWYVVTVPMVNVCVYCAFDVMDSRSCPCRVPWCHRASFCATTRLCIWGISSRS